MADDESFPRPYHFAWLEAHPWRTFEWLRDKIADGFHVHHIDGDKTNNEVGNLLLVDGTDHMMLHTGRLHAGIRNWRRLTGQKAAAALASIRQERREAAAKRQAAYDAIDVDDYPPPHRPNKPAPPLSEEMKLVVRDVLDKGGDLASAISAIEPMAENIGWRRLRIAVRREFLS